MTIRSNIRHRAWEHMFPTYEAEFLEIFDTTTPATASVIRWKSRWMNDNSYNMEIDAERNAIKKVTENMGIHPYYWEIYYVSNGQFISPRIRFYSEELLTMFKLAWP
jgi:hypothetical protein